MLLCYRQKKTPTYKDLDFMERHPEGILLEADTYAALCKTIERDCRVRVNDPLNYTCKTTVQILRFSVKLNVQ